MVTIEERGGWVIHVPTSRPGYVGNVVDRTAKGEQGGGLVGSLGWSEIELELQSRLDHQNFLLLIGFGGRSAEYNVGVRQ